MHYRSYTAILQLARRTVPDPPAPLPPYPPTPTQKHAEARCYSLLATFLPPFLLHTESLQTVRHSESAPVAEAEAPGSRPAARAG